MPLRGTARHQVCYDELVALVAAASDSDHTFAAFNHQQQQWQQQQRRDYLAPVTEVGVAVASANVEAGGAAAGGSPFSPWDGTKICEASPATPVSSPAAVAAVGGEERNNADTHAFGSSCSLATRNGTSADGDGMHNGDNEAEVLGDAGRRAPTEGKEVGAQQVQENEETVVAEKGGKGEGSSGVVKGDGVDDDGSNYGPQEEEEEEEQWGADGEEELRSQQAAVMHLYVNHPRTLTALDFDENCRLDDERRLQEAITLSLENGREATAAGDDAQPGVRLAVVD